MELETTILREVTEIRKDKHCMFPFTYKCLFVKEKKNIKLKKE